MPHDTHWQHWHQQYAEPDNPLNRRLSIIRAHLRHWFDEVSIHRHASEQLHVVSACAGDGRDVLAVLADREDADLVRVVLVELDPTLAEAARRCAAEAGLTNVEVRTADAGHAASYGGAVPADLVLLCGVFGNISDDDVRRTVSAVPQLAATGATVIWTRSRRAPDLTPQIRSWFAAAGFEEVAWNAPADELFSVGVHRFTGSPSPLDPNQTWFHFRADGGVAVPTARVQP